MMQTTGLSQSILESFAGPMTLFVPTNKAFVKMSDNIIENLENNQTLLAQVLKNHIVPGKEFIIDDLESQDIIMQSMAGYPLRINVYRKSKFYKESRQL